MSHIINTTGDNGGIMKTALLALALLLGGGMWQSAYAGYYTHSSSVYASYNSSSPSGIEGWGAVSSARNSGDPYQSIGCTFYSGYAYCTATNAAGFGVGCSTNNPADLVAIAGINSMSYIYFIGNPTNGGECTYLEISNSSEFLW